ncbi:MAG: alpha/beta fold hydrolase [Verrucomicrobia bacterium]|nr:alpha/beta fold hydrolase [Verrucomicrobiota bacterium]
MKKGHGIGRLFRPALWISVAGLLILQVAAWSHARAMLRFSSGVDRTPPPESLSFLEKARILITGIRLSRPENDRTPAQFGLAFETVRFRAADGVALEAWFIPAKLQRGLVILFHGYAQAKASLLNEAEAIYDMGESVLLVDFRGSGGSQGGETTVGVREAEDVAAAVQWARANPTAFRHVVLYGRSMGGAAALRAMSERGVKTDGLILEAVFDSMLNTVRNRFRAMGWPAFPAAESLVFWGGVQSGFNGFRHNPADYAAKVHLPVLVLQGEQDPRVTIRQAQRLFERLAWPRQLVTFPAGGHSSCLASDRDRWRRAVAEFLLVTVPNHASVVSRK